MTHVKHSVCSSVAEQVECEVGEIHNEVAEAAQKAGLHIHSSTHLLFSHVVLIND